MDNLIIKKINPKAGEEIMAVVRHFGLTFWPQILAVALLIILPFFLIFLLFGWGYWGVGLFLFLIFLGALYAVRTLVIWYYNAFIITNLRIIDIDQRGFFERVVSEAVYEKIQDVSYRRKGIWQTIFRYGDVRIQMVGSDSGLEIKNVRSPERVQELISQMAHLDSKKQKLAGDKNFGDPEVTPPTEEELGILTKSIEDLDEKQLERLEDAVRARIRQIKLKKLDQINKEWRSVSEKK